MFWPLPLLLQFLLLNLFSRADGDGRVPCEFCSTELGPFFCVSVENEVQDQPRETSLESTGSSSLEKVSSFHNALYLAGDNGEPQRSHPVAQQHCE